jgi:hypothetical protein
MITAFIIVAVLFGLKLAWNVSLPFGLAPGRGASLMPLVELVLLVAAIVLAAFEPRVIWRPATVALVGFAMAVSSYLLMVVTGGIASWLEKRRA